MKPQKNLTVYNMLVSLIKAEEDSIAQIRAMEDEVVICRICLAQMRFKTLLRFDSCLLTFLVIRTLILYQ